MHMTIHLSEAEVSKRRRQALATLEQVLADQREANERLAAAIADLRTEINAEHDEQPNRVPHR